MFQPPEAPLSEQLARALRRADRERRARCEAERLLEEKSLELFRANEQLRHQTAHLEDLVAARTAELERTLSLANAATEAKSRFLATMSHEIRTPLGGIIGMADLLGKSPLSGDQQNQLDLLSRSARSLLLLLNDILDFSKIEAGRLELEFQPFDPMGECETALSLVGPQATAKGLELRRSFENLPPLVDGDALRFRQVLLNLLSNAVKFTASGSVVLAARAEASGDHWILTVQVTDSGIGLTEEALAKLFQPFTQADVSTSRLYGGTGLGLAICSRIVEAMGGEIHARRETHGSTFEFFVRFHKYHPERETAGEQTAQSPTTLPAIRVLVVDDNPINRTVACGLLRHLGQNADVACDGPSAIERCQQDHYDLVLMDMQMPGMDGPEAASRILHSPGPHPRIVALTANAYESDRHLCQTAGMSGFLTKPLMVADLREEVRIAAEHRQEAAGD